MATASIIPEASGGRGGGAFDYPFLRRKNFISSYRIEKQETKKSIPIEDFSSDCHQITDNFSIEFLGIHIICCQSF